MYENMIVIDRQARETLQMQIRRQLAIGIVSRQFPLSEPLPSIRCLTSDLKVRVTTVALAVQAESGRIRHVEITRPRGSAPEIRKGGIR